MGRDRKKPIGAYDSIQGHHQNSKEINQLITEHIGAIAKLDKIQFTNGLPKTRSGKIMRRILRKIAINDLSNLGDVSTLQDPEVVQEIIRGHAEGGNEVK